MKFVKIDPPGTICFKDAFLSMIRNIKGRRFLEIGCGEGDISLELLKRGYTGTGIDFSHMAIEKSAQKLKSYITANKYKLIQASIFDNLPLENDFDIVISLFVMEHVQNDVDFLKRLKSMVRQGGHIIIAVPAQKDKWSLEDKTVGHLRRYNREDILGVFKEADIGHPEIWSVAVPIANILLGLSNLAVAHSFKKNDRLLTTEELSKRSGIREIPFKTVFPSFLKFFLNRVILCPLLFLQRLFYHTDLGIIMLVKAQYN